MIIKKKIFVLIILCFAINSYPQSDASFQIARLKYSGGGDWYNDPSADVNLLKFIQALTNIKVDPEYKFVYNSK